MLYRAFRRLAEVAPDFQGGWNVHGHYGQAEAWESHQEQVRRLIDEARPALHAFCASLLTHTRLHATDAPLHDDASEVVADVFNLNRRPGAVYLASQR